MSSIKPPLLPQYNNKTGGFLFRATLSVQVKVLDINDNAPSFSQAVYSATILEAAELGAPVTQVNPFNFLLLNCSRIYVKGQWHEIFRILFWSGNKK